MKMNNSLWWRKCFKTRIFHWNYCDICLRNNIFFHLSIFKNLALINFFLKGWMFNHSIPQLWSYFLLVLCYIKKKCSPQAPGPGHQWWGLKTCDSRPPLVIRKISFTGLYQIHYFLYKIAYQFSLKFSIVGVGFTSAKTV